MVGKTILHYEIIEPLGAGGMGEVYRARDTKLERDVAIKVLPEDLADDPDRLARLQREAKLLAALNHPNIATVHALEGEEGASFLVLELVTGESLEWKLATGPLPVEKALDVCKQIAEALEAAHGEGIIHRDLKPANVLVTPDGRAKVLDFGIAKSMQVDAEVAATAQATNLTVAGTLVGTPSYMSPEQVRGGVFDKRVDIWAFGCLLFETLTAKSAFAKETMADTLAAIIDQEPDWRLLPDATPAGAHRLLHRCLAKDPRDRLHDIADARIEIEEALADPSPEAAETADALSAPGSGRAISWRTAAATVIIAITALIATLGVWSWNSQDEAPQAVSIPVRLPAGFELDDNRLILAISPDGSRLAYVGRYGDDPRQLFAHEVGELEPRAIPGTEEARFPFFSADGRSVGFRQTGELKKVSLSGGDPVPLARVSGLKGASWEPDGTIVYVPSYGAGIWRVSADGGEPELVIAPDEAGGELDVLWPVFLPDGDHVLYTSTASDRNRADIAVVSLATGARKTLYSGGFYPRYSPPGHLVFGQRDLLLAVPFDLDRLEVTGSAEALAETVRMAQGEGSADFALSADGSLAYISGGPDPFSDNTMVLVDREGTIEPLSQAFGADPRFSPDGGELVSWRAREEMDVWRYDLVRNARSRVTLDPAWDGYSIWTPDGSRILFASDRAGSAWSIFSTAVNGSGAAELLLETDHQAFPNSWSADGRFLAFTQAGPETRADIWVYSADNPANPEIFVATEHAETEASFSPNGKFIAYRSDETGREEIYVRPYPERLPQAMVSTEGGTNPRWGPDGRELFYVGPRSTGGDLMVVSVETEPELVVGNPRLLLDAGLDSPQRLSTARGYDISPDGQRFVMSVQQQPAPRELNLVLNWFQELKRLVPTGR